MLPLGLASRTFAFRDGQKFKKIQNFAAVRSFVRSFARSFVRSFARSFARSFVRSFVRSFARPPPPPLPLQPALVCSRLGLLHFGMVKN